MKKILTSLLLVLSLVLLLACKPTDDTDKVAPVIFGANATTITVGDSFDPLAGVTASDDVDGPITLTSANITGTVNVDVVGTYTLKYTVSDKAGNVATKDRVITVLEAPGLGNLVGGDFQTATLADGWVTWSDQTNGYEMAVEIVDGVLEIDITSMNETDEQWWAVQLQYNKLMLEPFVSYKLTFKIKADDVRYMNHQIQGGGLSSKPYGEMNIVKIENEWITVEKDFYTRNEGVDAQLQFSFGNFAAATGVPAEYKSIPTKIYLDDIKIVEGPVLENTAPEITAPNLVVKTGTATAIKQGITVTDDFTDIQVADVSVVQDSEDPVLFVPQSPTKGVYKFKVTATDDEGLVTEVTRTITVADPWNRPTELTVAEIGGWDVNSSTTVESWFIRMIDLADEEAPYVTHTNPEAGVIAFEIHEIPDADYKSAYKMNQVQYFSGTYTVTFEAKADLARWLRIVVEQAGLPADEGFQHIELTEDWVTYTLTYVFEADQFHKGFEFSFGSLATSRGTTQTFTTDDDILTTIYIRNFDVTYTE